MKKIVLLCSAGMSTSILVNKMRQSAADRGFDAEVNAFSVTEAENVGRDADVILLGPQIKFNLTQIKELLPDKIVEVIDMRAYGTMNGEKIIDRVLTLLDESK